MSDKGNERPPVGDERPPVGDERPPVGYKQPPIKNRFKKGSSGNPNGRPKRPQPVTPLDYIKIRNRSSDNVLMEELERIVTIREGDETTQLSKMQAMSRSIINAAIKGNIASQKLIIARTTEIEARERQARTELLDETTKYKREWTEKIEEAERTGRELPEVLPHPDDIILDFIAGTVTICGPRTKEEKVLWDRRFAHQADAQAEVTSWRSFYEKERKADEKALCLQGWKDAQLRYDRINDNLPVRYRRNLEDRCWMEGASHAGSQKKRHWPGDYLG